MNSGMHSVVSDIMGWCIHEACQGISRRSWRFFDEQVTTSSSFKWLRNPDSLVTMVMGLSVSNESKNV